MVARLVWVMKFGCVQGNGGPRRVSYTLEYRELTVHTSIQLKVIALPPFLQKLKLSVINHSQCEHWASEQL